MGHRAAEVLRVPADAVASCVRIVCSLQLFSATFSAFDALAQEDECVALLLLRLWS